LYFVSHALRYIRFLFDEALIGLSSESFVMHVAESGKNLAGLSYRSPGYSLHTSFSSRDRPALN
jgi:hypothetical protein